jgi:hypothetical protein
MADFLSLQDAIQAEHKVGSIHVMTVPVHIDRAQALWEGKVEVFMLIGHASAKTVYAWLETALEEGAAPRIVTALHTKTVNSAEVAVMESLKRSTP